MISVKMTTTKGELKQIAMETMENISRRAILVLQKVGEEAVNVGRNAALKSGKNWTDQTGNLRSSVGYVICKDGVPIIQSKFEKVDGPKRDETTVNGSEEGRNYALSLCESKKGIVLVVVAGMSYAMYVADKGYDVLSSSQVWAQMRIPQLFEEWAKYDETHG